MILDDMFTCKYTIIYMENNIELTNFDVWEKYSYFGHGPESKHA